MWTWSTGLGIAVAGGHESAPIRRAWVRGGPVAWSPANGAPGGAATRELGNPPAGLGEPPPVADISRDRRAWGLAASGLAAIPPNSHAHLTRAKAGWRAATSLPRDRHKHWNKIKLSKTKTKQNKTRWRGAAYCLVWSSVTVHTRGRIHEHTDEDLNSNNNI